MENTPTKVYTRTLSENSCVCLQCNETVFNPFYKRRIFSAESGKSKACQLLEKVLDVEINQSTVETDIICRNCNDKNSRLVCKLEETRSVYENSKKQRCAQGKENQLLCVKRLAKDGREMPAKKRLNMESENTNSLPKNAFSTKELIIATHAKATQTEEPSDKVSAVNVSSQLHIQVFYIKCFICTSIMPFIFK